MGVAWKSKNLYLRCQPETFFHYLGGRKGRLRRWRREKHGVSPLEQGLGVCFLTMPFTSTTAILVLLLEISCLGLRCACCLACKATNACAAKMSQRVWTSPFGILAKKK